VPLLVLQFQLLVVQLAASNAGLVVVLSKLA
jgi:hypothetical protein